MSNYRYNHKIINGAYRYYRLYNKDVAFIGFSNIQFTKLNLQMLKILFRKNKMFSKIKLKLFNNYSLDNIQNDLMEYEQPKIYYNYYRITENKKYIIEIQKM